MEGLGTEGAPPCLLAGNATTVIPMGNTARPDFLETANAQDKHIPQWGLVCTLIPACPVANHPVAKASGRTSEEWVPIAQAGCHAFSLGFVFLHSSVWTGQVADS